MSEIRPEDLETASVLRERETPNVPETDLASLHLESRRLSSGLELLRENERIVSQGRQEALGPPKSAARDAPEEGEGEVGLAGTVARDVGLGIVESFGIKGQVTGGVIDAFREVGATAGDLDRFMEDLGVEEDSPQFIKDLKLGMIEGAPIGKLLKVMEKGLQALPEVRDARTTTGRAMRMVTKFVVGFAAAGKIKPLKALAQMGRSGEISSAAIRGAIADFALFDAHEERLSNMLVKAPALRNPVTEFLAADPDDPEVLGRFKNTLEGMGLGVVMDGLIQSLRLIRAARKARAAVTGVPEEQAVKEIVETSQRQRKAITAFLGDPKEPVFEVRPVQIEGMERQAATALAQPAEAVRAGAKVAPGGEVFINWSRIDSPDDVKTVIQNMADAFEPSITKARRGVRTWRATKLSAEQEDAWEILATRRLGEPLEASQSVAVRELWARSGANLLEIAKELKADPSDVKRIAFRKSLAIHNAIQEQVIAARTETARALNAWKIGVGDDVAFTGQMEQLKELIRADGDVEHIAERVIMLADAGMVKEADSFVYGSAVSKGSDMIRQLFYASLLSSPHTHARNVIGNTATVPLQMLERKFANLFGRAFGQENVPTGETLSMFYGAIQGFKRAFRVSAKGKEIFQEAKKLQRAGEIAQAKELVSENADEFGTFYRSLVTGESGIGAGKVELPRLGAFDPEKLGLGPDTSLGRVMAWIDTMTRMPMRALAAADEVFKTTTFDMELNARAWRKTVQELDSGKITQEQFNDRLTTLINNPDDEMRLASQQFAEISTFTNEPLDTPPWGVAKSWQRLPVLGRITLPFRRTPYNLATFTFQRTPLAPFVRQWNRDILSGGAKADIAWSKFLVGNAILLTMADLALNGNITGQGPPSSSQRQTLRRGGWEPWSVRVQTGEDVQGNPTYRYFTYRSLEPVSTPIGLAANTVDILRHADWDDDDSQWDELIIATSMAIAAQVTSQNYMSGVSNFFDAMSDPQRYGERWWQRLGTLVIPRGVSQITRFRDPTLRMAEDVMDSIRRDTPGLSKELPPARDVWGRPIDRSSGIGSVYDLISPVYSKAPKPEPIDRELNRLEAWIGTPQKRTSFNGVIVDLSTKPRIYSRYVQLQGNALTKDVNGAPIGLTGKGLMDELNALVTGNHPLSKVYDLMADGPEGGKADEIRRTVNVYRRAAREQLLVEFPELAADVQRRADEKAVRFKFEEGLQGVNP